MILLSLKIYARNTSPSKSPRRHDMQNGLESLTMRRLIGAQELWEGLRPYASEDVDYGQTRMFGALYAGMHRRKSAFTMIFQSPAHAKEHAGSEPVVSALLDDVCLLCPCLLGSESLRRVVKGEKVAVGLIEKTRALLETLNGYEELRKLSCLSKPISAENLHCN
ncbi:hypothetical protein WAI453_010334 [Rhynchosporium graminicola]